MKKKDYENELMKGHEDFLAIKIKGHEYGNCGEMLVMGHQCLIMHVTGRILCDAEILPLGEKEEITIFAKRHENQGSAIITIGEREYSTDSDAISFDLILDFTRLSAENQQAPPPAHLMLLSYNSDKGRLAFRLIDSTDNRWQWETLMQK